MSRATLALALSIAVVVAALAFSQDHGAETAR